MEAASQGEGAGLSAERCDSLLKLFMKLEPVIYLCNPNASLRTTSSRLKEFKSSLFAVFQSAHAQSVKMTKLMDEVNKERESRFTESEVRAALARMQDDNQVMVADDIVFLI